MEELLRVRGILEISVFYRELDRFIKRVRIISDILTVPESSHLTRSMSVMEKVLTGLTDLYNTKYHYCFQGK